MMASELPFLDASNNFIFAPREKTHFVFRKMLFLVVNRRSVTEKVIECNYTFRQVER